MIPRARRHPSYALGFTLVEIAVVLVIIAIMIAMAAFLTRGIAGAQKRSLSASRIATVDSALVQFVMQQRRLPCPADGRIATGGVGAGVEMPSPGANPCTNTQQFGVVPWVTLGLTEQDATDGWDHRLTYRLEPVFAVANALDMSACDPAGGVAGPPGSACNAACTNATLAVNCVPPLVFLSTKGLQVRNVVGTVVMIQPTTGAAYVVISHGESGGGAYLNTGLISTSTTADGIEEQKNYANAASMQPYYLDDSTTDVPGANHFDDIVSRPTILSLVAKAGLAPRSH